ncbi:FAD-dependent oxidoreductase [Erythrobacter mangrovi]|uniref:FAD-dependent oxidoreductase n=1 Tax=Erythrobacter mangrovi TaxID=2739433 RepID=A0A7D3X9M8_9SPHN|nr:FAD-dependent oxidoreductase [Erythrobacter mangrovi]QKG70120.1 FAD-dependent oxidoreductase [Erythrobacter mangrovi]
MTMPAEPTLLLVGAGHAHLGVIDDWRRNGTPKGRTLLVEPLAAMQYSGMVPGWIAGEYRASELAIPLAPLVEQAGITWHQARLAGIDPRARVAKLDDGSEIAFDVCSIATGGAGRAARAMGNDPRLLDIRPLDRFIGRWQALRDDVPQHRRVAVIGGGAGGVELAFGMRNSAHWRDLAVTLVIGEAGLLPSHPAPVRKRVTRELERQGIALLAEDAAFERGELVAGGRSLEPLDLVVAAVGSGAPDWPRENGLPVDPDGFIAVDRYNRACGQPHIFAVGDVARRTDRDVAHSGVHAVYSGPVLARNLRRSLSGEEPARSYSPSFMDFYLLNTCRGEAIASYAALGVQGRGLRVLKNWLDRRWIKRFTRSAAR